MNSFAILISDYVSLFIKYADEIKIIIKIK